MKSNSIKDALRVAFKKYRIAQETGNRELQRDCRMFIRRNYRNRHANVVVLNGV